MGPVVLDGGAKVTSGDLEIQSNSGADGFCGLIMDSQRVCLGDKGGIPRVSNSSGDVYVITDGGTERILSHVTPGGPVVTFPVPGQSITGTGEGNVIMELRTDAPYADAFCLLDGGSCYTGSINLTNVIQTTSGNAAYNLFVDGSQGSDSNACIGSGVMACLTIEAAINKMPKVLRDLGRITIAGGSYAGFYVSDFSADLGWQQGTGGLDIVGTLVNSTLASGSPTGTATGGSAGSNQVYGTLVNSAATWTAGDLVGRLLCTSNNTGCVPIETNTSTTIGIIGSNFSGWTTPVNGVTTYAIMDSATLITSTVSLPATPIESSVAGRAAIVFANNTITWPQGALMLRNIKIATSSGNSAVELAGGGSVRFYQMQIQPTGVGSLRGIRGGTSFPYYVDNVNLEVWNSDVYLQGTQGAVLWYSNGTFLAQNSQFRGLASGHSQFAMTFNGTGAVNLQNNSITGFPSGILYANALSPIIAVDHIYCGTYSSSFGISIGPSTTVSSVVTAGGQVDHVDLAVCDVGINMMGPGALDLHGITGSAGTTALTIRGGGYVYVNSANLGSFVQGDGGTGQYQVNIDYGKVTAAFSDFTTGTIITGPQGSRGIGE